MTEILLAMWGNVHGFAIAATIAAACIAGCAFLAGAIEESDGAKAFARRMLITAAVALPFALAPSLGGIWEARIALIKYELAAPENVKAATETIERIATKLECKYLGGCEEPKTEGK